MGAFIEERISAAIRLGAEHEDSYPVEVTRTASGGRYASLKHGRPYRTFDISYIMHDAKLAAEVESLYHRTYGGYAGFRVRAWRDFTTAVDGRSPYTALDCALPKVSAGVYQLVKEYGRGKPALPGLGRPRRTLYKPVSGKVAVAVAGQSYPAAQWAVDTTTGRITLAANKSRAIAGVARGASTVLTVGSNTFVAGESVVISGVTDSSVNGSPPSINGRRALITALTTSTITVAIDSSAMADYGSGGTVQTWPLDAGVDVVTGGCEFDIPVAFDSAFSVSGIGNGIADVAGLRLEELLNP